MIQTLPPDIDGTQAVQTWIDQVPDGSIVKLSGRTLNCDQTIVLKDRKNLCIDGQGATIQTLSITGDGSPETLPSKAARTRAHIRLIGGDAISIYGVTIASLNPNAAYIDRLEAQHAFDIQGTTNVEIYACTVRSVFGDFAYWGPNIATMNKSSGRMHGCLLRGAGRQGVSFTGCRGVTVDHNDLDGIGRSAFDLEPNTPTWGCDDVRILDNTLGSHIRNTFLASKGNGPVDNVTVARNIGSKPFNVTVGDDGGGRRSNWAFINNVSDAGWGSAYVKAMMSFQRIDHLLIANNTLTLQKGRGNYALTALGCTDVNVLGNLFKYAAGVYWPTDTPGITEEDNTFA